MKAFFTKLKRTVAAALVLLSLFALLCGCVTFRMRIVYDPFPSEFEETKWVCRELDLTFYVLNRTEVIGAYTVDGTTYWGNAYFTNRWVLHVSVDFCAPTADETAPFVLGELSGDYRYDEETGTLVLSWVHFRERGSGATASETFPETLTFDPAGSIAQTPTARMTAEELEMTLCSFSGIDGFYKGEVMIDGIRCSVIAVKDYEIGRFEFVLTNTEPDKKKFFNSLCFPPMTFETLDGRTVATVKGYKKEKDVETYYPIWFQYFYDLKTITFHPVPIE